MTRTSPGSALPAARSAVRFTSPDPLHAELKRSAARHFAETGRSTRGDVRMWTKTAVILAWAAGSYALLLGVDRAGWVRVLLAVSLGLAIAGIGFSVMHDANHGSYARGEGPNRALGFALDLIGGGSYFWRHKHNVLHHTYTNVSGLDVDIAANPLLRFAPDQPRRPFMRFQHLYVWALYAVYPLGWWLVDDFRRAFTGRIGDQPIPRPPRWELLGLFAGRPSSSAGRWSCPSPCTAPGSCSPSRR
jgi:linoleoyl-CoA desaturase